MTTIINTPAQNSDDSSSVAMIVGMLLALGLIALFLLYAFPQLRGETFSTDDTKKTTTEIKVDVPVTPVTPVTTPAQ